MEMLDEEFQFVLEMVILRRNDTGATLTEIRDDFQKYLGIDFEPLWGYRCWEEQIRPMITNVMLNVTSKIEGAGCILYYMNLDAAIKKLSYNLTDNMAFVCEKLGITLKKLNEIKNASIRSHSGSSISQTNSTKSSGSKSKCSQNYTVTRDCIFYGHSVIGDDFFLEIANIDWKFKKITNNNNVQRIGQCISGQTLHSAVKNIKHAISDIYYDRAIINLGSVDLLQGRELIDMMKDAQELCYVLAEENNIFPVMTTIPPLANQMHNDILERKRKSFNKFLMQNFDCIDIELCFLNIYGRTEFQSYQRDPKYGTGTRHPFVFWNHIGRQIVIRKLKRQIPNIYNEYY